MKARTDNNGLNKIKKIGKTVKKVGNGLFVVVIAMILLMVFFVVRNRATGGTPSIAGHHMYIVLSGSMAPAFDTGSVIFVKPMEPSDINEGDIITYRGLGDSDILTTHRVVEVMPLGQDFQYITKGDANEVEDPNPIPDKNLVGKVRLAIPYLGYLLNYGQTKQGMLVLIIVPGMLLIISEGFKLYKNINQSVKGKRN